MTQFGVVDPTPGDAQEAKPMPRYILPLAVLVTFFGVTLDADAKQPNVLFIAIDDQNDWIGAL